MYQLCIEQVCGLMKLRDSESWNIKKLYIINTIQFYSTIMNFSLYPNERSKGSPTLSSLLVWQGAFLGPSQGTKCYTRATKKSLFIVYNKGSNRSYNERGWGSVQDRYPIARGSVSVLSASQRYEVPYQLLHMLQTLYWLHTEVSHNTTTSPHVTLPVLSNNYSIAQGCNAV